MTILTDKARTAGFLIWDNIYQSREEGLYVATGAALPGSFVTRTAVQGTAAAKAGTQNVGNATITAGPVVVAASQSGVYRVTMTSPTAFTVTAPDGTTAGTGTLGTAYSTGISFTATAGSTAMAVGDQFLITADITEFNWTPATVAANIHGILFEGVTAAGTFKRTVIARNAEVQSSGLIFGTLNQGAVITQLNTLGIAVRIQ